MDSNKKLVSWFILLIVVIAAVAFFFWFSAREADAQWVYHAPSPVVVHRAPVWTYAAPVVIRYRTYYNAPAPYYRPVVVPPIARAQRYPTPIRSFFFGVPAAGCTTGY